MTSAKPSEASIAALVVSYLEGCGHDVYQEVAVRGGVADIICLVGKGREIWDVEVKTGWSLDLLEQCVQRRMVAHRVFAAVPKARANHAHLFRKLGIGTLFVTPSASYGGPVTLDCDWMPPRTSSHPLFAKEVRERVCEGHKTHAKAGAIGAGGRYSPWRQTCDAVARAVREVPGATLKEVIASIKHHYSSPASARASLAHWIEGGKIPGVRINRDGGLVRLFPEAK